jgi:hypothetical protein
VAFFADVSGWADFEALIGEIDADSSERHTRFLTRIGDDFKDVLVERATPHSVTGTYLESITSTVTPGRDPELFLELFPQGPEADRLHIYAKVLEGGAVPNPIVPTLRIMEWAGIKFGNPNIGIFISKAIKRQGIQPHPIQQSLFLLDGNLDPIGLTSLAISIVEEAVAGYRGYIEEIVRRGKLINIRRVRAGTREGGQFARL